jgi:hypothetical protein
MVIKLTKAPASSQWKTSSVLLKNTHGAKVIVKATLAINSRVARDVVHTIRTSRASLSKTVDLAVSVLISLQMRASAIKWVLTGKQIK